MQCRKFCLYQFSIDLRPIIRRFLRCLTVALALLMGGLILALFTSQYWLSHVLPSALKIAGVESESIHRSDEGRIVIDELSYSSETVAFTSRKVILPNLYKYFLAYLIRKQWDAASRIEIEEINISIRQNARSEKESQVVFPADSIQSFRSAYRDVVEMIPPVSINALNISSDKLELTLNDFEITDTNLSGLLKSDFLPQSIALNATLEPNADWIIYGALDETALTFDLVMTEISDGYFFSGQIRQPGELIELDLELEYGEALPKVFRLNSSGFTLDASLFSNRQNQREGSIELQFIQIDWNDGAYEGNIQLSSNFINFPGFPTFIKASVEIEGDSTAMKIQSLSLRSPMIETSLNQPVLLFLKDGIRLLSLVEDAELTVFINLSKQSWVEAEGQLKARVQIPAGRSLTSTITHFKVSGGNLTYAGQRVQSVQVTGSFQDSTIVLESGSMRTDSENDGMIVFNGQVALLDQTLDLDYEIRLASEFINACLEKQVIVDQLWIKGHAEGSWSGPELNFEVLEAKLAIPELNVISLHGIGSVEDLTSFKWNGFAESAGAYVYSEIAGLIDTDSIHIEISNLTLYDPEFPKLVLSEPVAVDFDLSEDSIFDRLSVSDFEWNGVEEQLSGTCSPESGLSLGISNFSCARLNRWFCRPVPVYKIDALTASIAEFDPFLTGELNARVSLILADSIYSKASLVMEFSNAGIHVDTLELIIDETNVAQGNFMLPLRFAPMGTDDKSWELLPEGALQGKFYTHFVPILVDLIYEATGISIEYGEFKFDISGDPMNTEGELEMTFTDLDAGNLFSNLTLPVIDSIKLRATANAEHLEISEFQAFVNQSELEGSVALPMDHLTDWLQSDVREVNDLLKTLTGDLTLTDWQMENWIELLPVDIFRRSGFLSGSLKVDEGLDLSGFLKFRDFALRPTASLPSIDHISGNLLLADKRLELQFAKAQVGGNNISVNGWVGLQSMEDIFWDIELSGENIPILRTTEMILRSDIDLKAKHLEKSDKPLVQGRLDLRASTLLIEFDPLAPSTEFGPELKPPFFSIEQEPVNDWLFDVTVFGETFMRVRSPYFKTQLSADFHIGGSFQEPELIGRLTTTNGQLSFPGVKMLIDKGDAFIEPSSPDTVYLDFMGTAQSALHVITMEISNTLEEPYIQFHATPELSNTSIIQLLATGTTNEGGVASVGLYLGKGFLGPGSINETLMDRITIDFGKEQSRTGRQTFDARFDLNQDWSLNGGYDQYGAYNMNLIWRLLGK